ncbi:uncharacterized protein [Halyomorpha halys]|uniref:uncharacterized protein n=1 Tax=Halyomorpha halys TaxID=286706 RepID=UPI0034D377B9
MSKKSENSLSDNEPDTKEELKRNKRQDSSLAQKDKKEQFSTQTHRQQVHITINYLSPPSDNKRSEEKFMYPPISSSDDTTKEPSKGSEDKATSGQPSSPSLEENSSSTPEKQSSSPSFKQKSSISSKDLISKETKKGSEGKATSKSLSPPLEKKFSSPSLKEKGLIQSIITVDVISKETTKDSEGKVTSKSPLYPSLEVKSSSTLEKQSSSPSIEEKSTIPSEDLISKGTIKGSEGKVTSESSSFPSPEENTSSTQEKQSSSPSFEEKSLIQSIPSEDLISKEIINGSAGKVTSESPSFPSLEENSSSTLEKQSSSPSFNEKSPIPSEDLISKETIKGSAGKVTSPSSPAPEHNSSPSLKEKKLIQSIPFLGVIYKKLTERRERRENSSSSLELRSSSPSFEEKNAIPFEDLISNETTKGSEGKATSETPYNSSPSLEEYSSSTLDKQSSSPSFEDKRSIPSKDLIPKETIKGSEGKVTSPSSPTPEHNSSPSLNEKNLIQSIPFLGFIFKKLTEGREHKVITESPPPLSPKVDSSSTLEKQISSKSFEENCSISDSYSKIPSHILEDPDKCRVVYPCECEEEKEDTECEEEEEDTECEEEEEDTECVEEVEDTELEED